MKKKQVILGIFVVLTIMIIVITMAEEGDLTDLLNRIIKLEQNDKYQDERLKAIEEQLGIIPPIPLCIENWQCSVWSECNISGVQVRTCIDLNNCGNTTNKPEEIQNCVYDKCKNVVCSDSKLTCPDGFVAGCNNTCDSTTGQCSNCIPNCTGHEEIKKIVILQMDDLQAWWLEKESTIVVSGLISKGIPVTLGVVPSGFYERDGVKGGIVENLKNWTQNYPQFVEAAVHTYDHDDYSKWSLDAQTTDIIKGKAEFDKRNISTWTFVPAYNWGNSYTPQAIVNAGLLIGFNALENPYIDSNKNPMILEDGAWYGDDFSSWDYTKISTLIDNNVNKRGYYIVGFHQQDLRTSTQRTAFFSFIDKMKSSNKYRFMTAKQYYQFING